MLDPPPGGDAERPGRSLSQRRARVRGVRVRVRRRLPAGFTCLSFVHTTRSPEEESGARALALQ